MVNYKYRYKLQYRKYQTCCKWVFSTVTLFNQQKRSLYIKNLSSKTYKLKLLRHIIILACLDFFDDLLTFSLIQNILQCYIINIYKLTTLSLSLTHKK